MKHLSIQLKVAALAALLVLGGCASSGGATKSEKPAPAPAAAPAAPAPAKQATPPVTATPAAAATNAGGATGKVVFFRESKFAGAAVSFKVREGAQELGKLSSGTYFVANLPVGAHAFTVHSEAKDVLNLEVEPGETYYIQGSISMGFLVGRPNLAPSTAATFDSMKAKLDDSAAK
jgi:hypothetical protein